MRSNLKSLVRNLEFADEALFELVRGAAVQPFTGPSFIPPPGNGIPPPSFGVDDIPGDPSTNATLELGVPQHSAGNFGGDQDWLAVELTAGVAYRFEIQGSEGTATLDASFGIVDSANPNAGFSPVSGAGEGFIPTHTGIYYIVAMSTPGAYTLLATPLVDTIAGNPGSGASFAVGETVHSRMDHVGDEDWFAIDLVGGQTYEFMVTDAAFNLNTVLRIYDANGNLYATGPLRMFVEIAQSGTYYVTPRLGPPFGNTPPLGSSYGLRVENEASAGPHTLQTMIPGVRQEGGLFWPGDSDWYRIELQAGVTYEFHAEGPFVGDVFQVDFRVRDANGSIVAIDNGAPAPITIYTPQVNGTYFLEVTNALATEPAIQFEAGFYRVAFDPIAPIDAIAGNAATTASLNVGGVFQSTLDAESDHDWIAVQLIAGKAYHAFAVGTETGEGVFPAVQLVHPDGSRATVQGGSYVIDVSGTYYLDVSKLQEQVTPFFAGPAGKPGAYSVTLQEDIRQDLNTTATLAVGASAVSTISKTTFFPTDVDFVGRDEDWYRIDLVAGEKYLLFTELVGDDSHLLEGADVKFLNAAGQVVADEIFINNAVTFTATASDVHYAAVFGDFFQRLRLTDYRVSLLHLDVAPDTLAGGTNSTGVLTTAAPLTSAIDYATDIDWVSFGVVEGQFYTVTLSGAGATPLPSGQLTIAPNTSAFVGFAEAGANGTASVTVHADFSGTMWAGVSAGLSVSSPGSYNGLVAPLTGGYRLTLSSSPTNADALAGDATTSGVIAIGAAFSSSIDFDQDVDWIKVTLTAGEYYDISVNPLTGTAEALGMSLSVQGGASSPSLTDFVYKATSTGDHFLQVSGLRASDYTLSISHADPISRIAGAAAQPKADGVFRIYFTQPGEIVTGALGTQVSVGWTQGEIDTILSAWSTFAQVSNLSFEVTNNRAVADFTYLMLPIDHDPSLDLLTLNSGQFAGSLGDDREFGLVTFAYGDDTFSHFVGDAAPGSFGWANLLALTGSLLGLGPGAGLAGVPGVNADPNDFRLGLYWLNQGVYTAMAAQSNPGWVAGRTLRDDVPDFPASAGLGTPGIQATPMALDIAALQAMYGANTTTNSGATTYNLSSLVNQQFQSIWDVGGVDALIVDPGNVSGAVIDLRAATLQYEWGGGGFVSYIRGIGGGYTIAGGVVIENATGGAGPDDLIGNSANNVLNGGGGDDIVDGGIGGADTLIGGAGADTLSYILAGAGVTVNLSANSVGGAAAGDTISAFENLLGSAFNDVLIGDAGDNVIEGGAGADALTGGAGIDTASYAGSSAAVNVTLGGAASGGDATGDTLSGFENLTGSDFNDQLTGNAGDNRLDGGIGADTLAGGAGNDTYVLDNKDDVVTELAGEGTDRLRVVSSYQLPANVEILEAIGSASSRLAGNATNDTILGNSGDNTLVGGAGADQLNGGLGFDRAEYLGSSAGVNINLTAQTASGGDAQGDILTSIEDLTGSNFNDVLVGSAAANFIFGEGGADQLLGLDGDDILDGGAGADLMSGGAGNDSYVVDDAGDAIAEASVGGIDFVEASVSFTLGNGLEDLTLTGAGALSGTGNALDNFITGNSAANTLIGNDGNDALDGAAGADAMDGGAGDDIYFVDEAGDVVSESSATGGVDTVVSNISFTLGANFENLFLDGVPDSSGISINGGGNELDNLIVGDRGSNVISGFGGNDILDSGGDGDRLIGGEGDDLYLVGLHTATDELAGGGFDTVRAAISWFLEEFVEQLDLVGEDNIFGIGSSGDDTINGNIGDNFLSGMFGNDTLNGGFGNDRLDGGFGLDALSGGQGDDEYTIDAGDVVTELANEGNDTVKTSLNGHTLGVNLENLVLEGTFGGAFGVGNGNALNNTITGNFAGNILNGGAGDDMLIGGANFDFLHGEAGDDTLEGGTDPDTLDGGAGVDTASYVGSSAGVTVNLATGLHFGGDAEGDVLAGVENIVGSINMDSLTGDSAPNELSGSAGADQLFGLAGADVLDGGLGADSMFGGEGDDIYFVDNAGDVTFEAQATWGVDLVQASVSYALGTNIDNLLLLAGALNGSGNVIANVITGNGANNLLFGFAGNDTLVGNGGADTLDGGTADDVMAGGDGDDTYVVDSAGDVVTESSALGGTDTVRTSVTRTLGANLENLVLIGAAAINGSGNALANIVSGNGAANALFGFAGNDALSGGAGDQLFGGEGDDTYIVSAGGVVTFEASAAWGADTVLASVGYALGTNIDNLTLTGTAIFATGNNLANVLTGNASNNTLVGQGGNDTHNGGLGADQMYGGEGNDRYIVDNTGDIVFEANAAWGVDTVEASVTFALSAAIDNLTLTGAAAINGNGNALNNIIVGNASANTLFGFAGNDTLNGGAGVDALFGGEGDDIYVVDNGADVAFEANTVWGIDLVQATVSYALGQNIDNLTLTGAAAINGTGNNLANAITGNSAANALFGLGGADSLAGAAGNDSLDGGAGDDAYVFAPGSGADTVTGFVAGGAEDTINLSAYNGSGVTWSISQIGADTVFALSNGDQITLIGVTAANLVQTDPFGYA